MDRDEDIKSLQEQIVSLRLRIDHQGESMAALVRHYVENEIQTVLKGRIPSKEVTDWATLECERSKTRKKDVKDLVMHSVKMSSAAAVAFFLWALWEGFKAKVTGGK